MATPTTSIKAITKIFVYFAFATSKRNQRFCFCRFSSALFLAHESDRPMTYVRCNKAHTQVYRHQMKTHCRIFVNNAPNDTFFFLAFASFVRFDYFRAPLDFGVARSSDDTNARQWQIVIVERFLGREKKNSRSKIILTPFDELTRSMCVLIISHSDVWLGCFRLTLCTLDKFEYTRNR